MVVGTRACNLAVRLPGEPASVPRARHLVRDFLARKHHDPAHHPGVLLSVSEACTNAVVHAYVDESEPGEIEVVAQMVPGDGLEIFVCDDGRGMLPRHDSPGVGLGLPLVATLAESFEVQARSGGGTQVRMAFLAV